MSLQASDVVRQPALPGSEAFSRSPRGVNRQSNFRPRVRSTTASSPKPGDGKLRTGDTAVGTASISAAPMGGIRL